MKKKCFGMQEMSGTTTGTRSTYSTMKIKSLFILLTAISLLLISSSFASAAINFSFSSPQSVEQNVSFQVSISAETNLTYDVKIFVNNDSRANSEILSDGEWKSPFYYLTSAFPASTQFNLRALRFGDYPICVRLRETGKSAYSEQCNNLTVIENPNPPQEQEPENNASIANSTQNNSTNQSNSTINNASPKANISNNSSAQKSSASTLQSNNQQSSSSSQSEDNEIIYLNNKPSANSNPQVKSSDVFMSKDEKIRLWVAYGFAGICIFILIAIMLRNR